MNFNVIPVLKVYCVNHMWNVVCASSWTGVAVCIPWEFSVGDLSGPLTHSWGDSEQKMASVESDNKSQAH
jgi:hypothetical protein